MQRNAWSGVTFGLLLLLASSPVARAAWPPTPREKQIALWPGAAPNGLHGRTLPQLLAPNTVMFGAGGLGYFLTDAR